MHRFSESVGELIARAENRRRTTVLVAQGGCLLLILTAFIGIAISNTTSSSSAIEVAKTISNPEAPRTVNILVAVARIDAGKALSPSLFRLEPVPATQAVGGISEISKILGMYARTPIEPGTPINGSLLTNVRPTNAVAANIPPGFRAVTIQVNVTSSVEGWARPGARVDVSWSTTIRGEPSIKVIAQNAQILSAERQLDPNTQTSTVIPSTVTLLLSEADSLKVHLGTVTGALSLALRGIDDMGTGTRNGTVMASDLLLRNRPIEPQVAPRRGHVRVRGDDGTVSKMDYVDGKLVPSKL